MAPLPSFVVVFVTPMIAVVLVNVLKADLDVVFVAIVESLCICCWDKYKVLGEKETEGRWEGISVVVKNQCAQRQLTQGLA